jgi:hypothetical protein
MHSSIHSWQRSSPQGLCRPAPCTRNFLSNLRSYFRFAKRKENSESPHGAVWPADRPPPINNQLLIRSLDLWGLNSSSSSAASLASRRPRPSVALRPQSLKILLCPFCGETLAWCRQGRVLACPKRLTHGSRRQDFLQHKNTLEHVERPEARPASSTAMRSRGSRNAPQHPQKPGRD